MIYAFIKLVFQYQEFKKTQILSMKIFVFKPHIVTKKLYIYFW